jgi:hypothetical protein
LKTRPLRELRIEILGNYDETTLETPTKEPTHQINKRRLGGEHN